MHQINKLSILLEVITTQSQARLVNLKLDCTANTRDAIASAREGRLYFKVMVGGGVRYFVRKADGIIFAAAGRAAPCFNRSFGTLDTINDFHWGNYEPIANANTPWRMVPTRGGYMTAVAV